MFKWFAIGTVAFFGFIFLSVVVLAWYLSPIVSIDGANGRVTLLGGAIDINRELGQVKVGDMVVNQALKGGVDLGGESDLPAHKVRLVRIPFNTAKMELSSNPGNRLSWSCRSVPGTVEPKVEVNAGIATLNLDVLNITKCLIGLPSNTAAEIHGVNGHMEVRPLDSSIDIRLDNGRVKFALDPSRAYDFDVHVKNGLQDFFPHSAKSDAVKVRVNVVNGMVSKE